MAKQYFCSGVAFCCAVVLIGCNKTPDRMTDTGSVPATAVVPPAPGKQGAIQPGTWPYVDIVVLKDYSSGGVHAAFLRIHMDVKLTGRKNPATPDIEGEFSALDKELKNGHPRPVELLNQLVANKDLDDKTDVGIRTLKAGLGCTKTDPVDLTIC